MLVGDARKIKAVVQNLTANARKKRLFCSILLFTIVLVKYTVAGSVSVHCNVLEGLEKVGDAKEIIFETVVVDTGCGIPTSKLQTIFREFEQVESSESRGSAETSVGEKSYHWIFLRPNIHSSLILRARFSSGCTERSTTKGTVARRIKSRRGKPFLVLHTPRATQDTRSR